MKIINIHQRLNERGIAHMAALLVVVLLISIGGTFLLVSSNANQLSRKPTTIRSAKLKVIGKVYGQQEGSQWCGIATVEFKIKTAGQVNEAYVNADAAGETFLATKLRNDGKGVWTAKVTGEKYKVCANKKGGKGQLPPNFVSYSAHVNSDKTHVQKYFQPHSVKVR